MSNEPQDPVLDAAEAREHAQAVFARMSSRHRVPPAQRARGSSPRRRGDAERNTQPLWQAGQDKALPNGDKD